MPTWITSLFGDNHKLVGSQKQLAPQALLSNLVHLPSAGAVAVVNEGIESWVLALSIRAIGKLQFALLQ